MLILTWLAFDWKTPERGEGPGRAVATRHVLFLPLLILLPIPWQPFSLTLSGVEVREGSLPGASEAKEGTGVGSGGRLITAES